VKRCREDLALLLDYIKKHGHDPSRGGTA